MSTHSADQIWPLAQKPLVLTTMSKSDRKRQQDRAAETKIVISFAIGALVAIAGSQGSAQVGGIPVFALCAGLAFLINLVAYVPAQILQTEKFFDLTGSLTYQALIVAALVLSKNLDARAIVVALMVAAWAARLGSFLFLRIRRDGGDQRFDRIKSDTRQFVMTWIMQGLWVLLTMACALSIVTAQNRKSFGAFGVIGLVVWSVGFVIEIVSDRQKSAFRAVPANKGRFISTGLWAWSRHPNYFGEIMLWVGVLIMAMPVLEGWRWVALVSPMFVALLLTKVSGVPGLERQGERRWGEEPAYQRYVESTPSLVMRPPRANRVSTEA